jgi:hypothetical protein
MLKPTLRVSVERITLLHHNRHEKLTLDLHTRFTLGIREKVLSNTVIAEVKQLHPSPASDILHALHKLKIYPLSFSKYCIGIATLNDAVKKNNFKESLRHIRKITSGI